MTVRSNNKKIKCLVWDLDNTLWDGILLEDQNVELYEKVLETIRVLDSRGIIQSISSKNDYNLSMRKLEELGIDEYFLYPQINWSPKSESIKSISKLLNIGLDTIAFIDDQSFERDEVSYSIPEILCIDATAVPEILDMPVMIPNIVTEDSRKRRVLYMNDIARKVAEETFEGPKEEFLASLNMKLTISFANKDDLKRAQELTVRTNQLNTTGYTYSYEQLDEFRLSKNHKLLIVELEDKYGSYGKVGLALLECNKGCWTIKLFLMSCRVISRGVGTILINQIINMALKESVKLRADFLHSKYNRMMYVTYKFAGFQEINSKNEKVLFENTLTDIQPHPYYIKVIFA
ncbi:HAD-IIIC family phosphatase [Bacillus wiedmannii]|uniref:HAD-IIIC family phosphatase n=1 Tax=Bacillus wiedmannii TaxID=1890302 RepID=UPI000BF0940D|nr:HAD-IIIC family phosphatase [Bacillus wiedmannii]PEL51883.1 hypothetical protein CN622_30115 [Bacillus wiedmannii]PEO05018.1 hypothetical protein CN562_29765 [Bacillus wiedmannii]PEP98156.1 hypothetical protein CN587_30340 [Bacillus wiedmannii]